MKAKQKRISLLSVVLVASLLITTFSAVFATEIVNSAKQGILENTSAGEKIHKSINISDIRNEGGDPPELLSTASALASAEKPWYEYIRYSSEPIGICDVNATTRIIFHDPYDYGNSLIMEIDDSITDWSSSNSLTATYETGNTISFDNSKSTDTVTGLEVAKGADTTSDVSVTTTEGRINTYNSSKINGEIKEETTGGGSTSTTKYGKWSSNTSSGAEVGNETGTDVGAEVGSDLTPAKAITNIHTSLTVNTLSSTSRTEEGGQDTTITTIDPATTTTSYEGYEVVDEGWTEDNSTTTTKTNVTSIIADRMSSSLGQNITETQSWSTTDNHSVSKTYNASYFNSSGSPLQWKIVKYKVIMPMMYKTQYLIDGEWVTAESGFCTLTTIQGTCRAWLENNQAFYEHWGTGEPVTWNEFWGTFFTKEKLVEAYQTRLYPDQIRRVSE